MVDMPLPDLPSKWRPDAPTTVFDLKRARWLLGAILIVSACWVAVNQATAKDKCQTTLGRLAVQFKLDSYFSNCHCMKPSLDFSDACNSMYLPLF
jgi:hypothetical protein